MKIKASEMPVGSCFRSRSGRTAKKLPDGRCATVDAKGRIRKGKCPRAGRYETVSCPLSLLGAHLGTPTRMVEIGSALPAERSDRKSGERRKTR